MHKAKSR